MESSAPDHAHVEHTFVGRARELDELQRHFVEAGAGHGRLILVTGEAGVGKTALAEQLAARLSSAARVYWGRCWENHGAPAFWPWKQLLRECVRGADRDDPYLAMLLGDIAAPTADAAVDFERVRFQLFAAVSRVLRDAAAGGPLLLIFDDLHAADLDSLLLLEFLLRELATAPVLALATLREMDAKDSPHRDRFYGQLGRAASRITLGSLQAAEVEEYVRATLGRVPAARFVADDLAGLLFETTGGHPLFLKEMLQLWLVDLTSGQVPSRELGVTHFPQQLIETVRQRLRPLRPPTHELLTLAATLGRSFELGLLQRAYAAHPAAASAAADWNVLDALDESVNLAVVRRDPEKPGRYSFTHALFREALYHGIAAGRRARLHGQIAATMETLYLAGRSDLVPEIAFHYLEAAPAGGARKAIDFARLAATQASGSSAHHDAMGYRAQALQAFDLHLAGESSADDLARERCDLLLELGYDQNRAALRDAAKATFLEAAALARTRGDAQRIGYAALGYGGASSPAALGGVDVFRFDTSISMEPMCSQLLSEALAAVGPAESTLRARLLSRLAVEMYFVGSSAERDALSREACNLATRLGDPATLAVVLTERLAAVAGVDNLDERLVLSKQVIPLAQAIGSRSLEICARSYRNVALLEAGEITEMESNNELARFITEAERMPIFLWGAKQNSAMQALLAGRFAEAEQLANEALQIGSGVMTAAPVVWMEQMHVIRRALGRHDDMAAEEGMMKAGIAALPMFPQTRIELAANYMALGRHAEARAEIDYIGARGFSDLRRDLEWLYFMAQTGEVCCFLGDREHGQQVYDLLLPFAARNATTTFGSLCSGSTARVLGMLAALRGDHQRAVEHFDAAQRGNRALRARPLLAQTQFAYAAVLFSAGDADPDGQAERLDRARRLLAEAMESARVLGMAPLLAQIERLSEQIQATQSVPGSVHARADDQPGGATADRGRPDPQHAAMSQAAILRREGDYWTVAYNRTTGRVMDVNGLHYLAHLLRHPGQEVHALDLIQSGESAAVPSRSTHVAGDAGPVLDAQAKAQYRTRLSELRAEFEQAEQFNDRGRSELLRAEIEALTEQLAAAVGLGGRDRSAASNAERARATVTQRIKAAIRRIGAHTPELADHLASRVKTGRFCVYRPDAARPIQWILD